jgi:carboxylate-amine ligase
MARPVASRLRAPYPLQPGTLDEAFTPDGSVRPHYAGVLAALGEVGVGRAAAAMAAGVAAAGMTRGASAGLQAFSIDPVPRVFARDEWAALEAGLAQRTLALDRFVADVYGPQETLREGIVPRELVETSRYFERDLIGRPVPRVRIGIAGPDVIRAPWGELLVLEDNVRTPTMLMFGLAARDLLRDALGPGAPVPREARQPAREGILRVLRAAAPAVADPVVVVLADRTRSAMPWELDAFGELLGVPAVDPEDLRHGPGDSVRLRDGRRVDVIFRRTSEERLRDDAGRLSHLGELLLPALLAGTVAVVNAFGTGVADDKRVHPYVEELVRWACGTEPLLRSVPEVDPRRALGDLRGHVVKPRSGSGGFGVMVGPLASEAQLAAARAALERDPGELVVQEAIAFSVHPTHVGGRLAPRHVDLRPFALCAGGRVEVVPGGLTRVALAEGDLLVNCSQGGSAKDVWVLD